jgi:hypothetical protein
MRDGQTNPKPVVVGGRDPLDESEKRFALRLAFI